MKRFMHCNIVSQYSYLTRLGMFIKLSLEHAAPPLQLELSELGKRS